MAVTTRGLFAAAIAALAWAMPLPLAAAGQDLRGRILQHEGWSVYEVPLVAAAGLPCCFDLDDHAAHRAGCDLDLREHSYGTSSEPDAVAATQVLRVYSHVAQGRIDQVRAYAATCPVRATTAPAVVDGVGDGDSVALLDALYRESGRSGHGDLLLAAIAFHATPVATTALGRLVVPPGPLESRKQALFWLGQARGRDGVEIADHYAALDPDPEFREHALFVLSQALAFDGYARILRVAGSDASGRVRSQALFWMAQTGDPRAAADILAALRRETDDDVREQAVFALSQLPDGRGDEALIGVLQGAFPKSTKQRAMFWLGQSGSPKALAFFDRALK